MSNICIIGTGYVGLVSGTCFAELGHNVICVDVDSDKIATLRRGKASIYEPGLDEMIARNTEAGRLSFTTSIDDAVAAGTRIFFIAVGTPTDPRDGGADVSYVFAAAGGVAQAVARARKTVPAKADDFVVIITKSTVPIGTNNALEAAIAEHLEPGSFAIASNPEFLREGSAIEDFLGPDRIVVGSRSQRAQEMMGEMYQPLTRRGIPMLVVSSVETAELVKYAANAFLAMKITFVNEIARLCEAVGGEIEEVAAGIGMDTRISPHFLKPGPGYGGSCFPKDTQALVKTAIEYQSPLSLVEAVIAANYRHKLTMIAKIRDAMGGSLAGKRIAVLGVAFKANTDDMRDAPALIVVPGLVREGATIVAYDPVAEQTARKLLPQAEFARSVEEAVSGASAVVLLTEWPEFATLDPTMLERAGLPVLVDLRNVLEPAAAMAYPGTYEGIGRSNARKRMTRIDAEDMIADKQEAAE